MEHRELNNTNNSSIILLFNNSITTLYENYYSYTIN